MFDFDPNSLLRLASLVPYAGSSADENQLPANADEAKKKNSFTPSTVAQDRLNELMQQMPQYQSPGLFGKITAGIIGAGYGPQAAQQYLMQPYSREMDAWKNQVGVAENMARDENTTNQIGRQLAYNQQQTSDREAALNEKAREADQKASNADARTQVYRYKAEHPSWIPKVDETGNLVFFDPQDPTKTVATGVTTDALTPSLRLELEQMRESAAMDRTQFTQNAETTRAQNKPGTNAKGAHVSRAFTAPDGTTWALMSDGSVAQMKDMPMGSTSVASAPTTTTNTQTTMDEPNRVEKFLGMQPTVKTEKTTTTTKTPGSPNASQTILMTGPDGKDYHVPAAQVEDAKKHGMVIKVGG